MSIDDYDEAYIVEVDAGTLFKFKIIRAFLKRTRAWVVNRAIRRWITKHT